MLVGYLDEADARIEEIIAQLHAVNLLAASRFLRSLERAHERLAGYPWSGHRIPEFSLHRCREFVVRPYRFFYFVDEARQMIWIVDIWHGAQLPTAPQLPAP